MSAPSRPPGSFAPQPGAAPLGRQVLAQARMESRLMLRNGEQLLLAVVIPLLVLVGGILAAHKVDLRFPHTPVDTLTPGVLALAVMSTSFTSLAIATGFERRYGVLKRLGASPLPRTGLLAGKVGALLLVELLQIAIIAAVAFPLGWRWQVSVTDLAGLVVCVLAGTAAFASLGLFLAGVLRAEATLAAANLVYLLLLAGGAVVFPPSTYGAAGPALSWLPSAALGNGMRTVFLDGGFPLMPVLVLLVWACAGTVLTARTFSWE
ncbi:MAG TPA: ABC transporter permease [Nocardioidaceae bacterium]|nr:ABC transporter permease [Nocardioidaceae bacterium]